MSWMNSIIYWLGTVRDGFANIANTLCGWTWPFYFLALPFLYIYYAFSYLVVHFTEFNTWLVWAAGRISQILDISYITNYFSPWISYATNAWNWVANAITNVRIIIDGWWGGAQQLVLFWIDQVKYWALAQFNTLYNWLAQIQVLWQQFSAWIPSFQEIIAWFGDRWNWILAQIITWGGIPAKEIALLIDSKLKEWFPFYASLAELWDKVVEFITDPLEWLATSLEDWFWGKEG